MDLDFLIFFVYLITANYIFATIHQIFFLSTGFIKKLSMIFFLFIYFFTSHIAIDSDNI